jgi:hypothetical protein
MLAAADMLFRELVFEFPLLFRPLAEHPSLSRNSFSPSGERGVVAWNCFSPSANVVRG